MMPEHTATILDYSAEHRSSIRQILTKIGWAEQYIFSAEQTMHNLAGEKESHGVYVVVTEEGVIGFLSVQYYAWNQLCQIHGLAVCPEFQRKRVASMLVARAEEFAHSKGARGIYVDTPITNTGGRRFYEAIGYRPGYVMPRYYEISLDGVTYQKFFER